MSRPLKLGFEQHCFYADCVVSHQYVCVGDIALPLYVHCEADVTIVKLFKPFHVASAVGPHHSAKL